MNSILIQTIKEAAGNLRLWQHIQNWSREDLRRLFGKCHPFFTGQQRAAQARGHIEQFNKRYGK